MHNQDVKKTGNRHSALLDQLIDAAEKAKPKESTLFADSIIKIASAPSPTLSDAMKKLATEVSRSNKSIKKGQITRSVEPGRMDGMGPHGPSSGPDMGEFGDVSEPDLDFDAMINDGGESGLEQPGLPSPEPRAGGDIQSAKKSLADALVALCGSPEEAIACLEGSSGAGLGDEMGDELDEGVADLGPEDDLSEEPLDEEPLGEEHLDEEPLDEGGDTLGQAAADMPAPMPARM